MGHQYKKIKRKKKRNQKVWSDSLAHKNGSSIPRTSHKPPQSIILMHLRLRIRYFVGWGVTWMPTNHQQSKNLREEFGEVVIGWVHNRNLAKREKLKGKIFTHIVLTLHSRFFSKIRVPKSVPVSLSPPSQVLVGCLLDFFS